MWVRSASTSACTLWCTCTFASGYFWASRASEAWTISSDFTGTSSM